MVHQTELVVGVGIPWTFDLERAGGLTGVGVTQVERDAAVFVPELLDRVEGRITASDARDRRIQSPAGDQQQREAGTGLLEMNANGAFFVCAHGSSPSSGLHHV